MMYLVTALPQILTKHPLPWIPRAELPSTWERTISPVEVGILQNSDNAVTRQQYGGRS